MARDLWRLFYLRNGAVTLAMVKLKLIYPKLGGGTSCRSWNNVHILLFPLPGHPVLETFFWESSLKYKAKVGFVAEGHYPPLMCYVLEFGRRKIVGNKCIHDYGKLIDG